MLRLLTFGGLALESRDRTPPRLRPQRLAILAVLAASDRGVSRERMFGLFWPDADDERARHSLRQALYALRQELGADVVQSDALLTLDRDRLGSDLGDFRAALAAGDRRRAAGLVTGPFLSGFYLPGAGGFERWVEEERASIATEAARAILSLAKESDAAGDQDTAVDWWRRLTLLDPVSGRFALGFLKALAARGDRAAALAFAREHESVVRRELESDPDPDIRRLESELRAMPAPEVIRVAPTRPLDRQAVAEAPPPRPGAVTGRPAAARRWMIVGGTVIGTLAAAALTANWWSPALGLGSRDEESTYAVGMIREEGIPDTLRIGGVLTDMLATSLARVAGLSVLANARLLELMLPGQDTTMTGYFEAARRAGATEILQGRLLSGPRWNLAMELQRVDLASGIVRSAYRVAADDRYTLVDSITAVIARDLRLGSPLGSVSEATTDNAIAYRLYEEGLRAYYQYDDAAARRLMQAALAEDSTFAMAAYYDARLSAFGDGDEKARRERALRLAARAPERERLAITAHVLDMNVEPAALSVAESLAARYPKYPRAFELLSGTLMGRGEWRAAVTAIERAVAIDSASEPPERQSCRLCDDLTHLANIYFWWDSLPAAERTAHRFLRLRPTNHYPWHILASSAAARGDTGALLTYLRRFHETNPAGVSPEYFVRRYILAEQYDEATRRLQPSLESPRPNEVGQGRWLKAILLRNQGRFEEAQRVVLTGGTPDVQANGLVAMERGHAREAVSILAERAHGDVSVFAPGIGARLITWWKTLYGMALLAAGDTAALRPLADTVEFWGQRSNYGRDRRAHHYLRGMLLVARGHDAEAAAELREAIHSPSHGFTRVNYELGKTLLRLNRAAEAVSVVRSALHGDIDGSNLYVTRTELHELLAEAFDHMGRRDSAAVHYGAVVRAWEHADPVYHARRDRARAWLARANLDSARDQPATGNGAVRR
jgi:DNA-binding SARP family transcriptional activator